MDAELIVYGVSDPHAHVTLQGEPVPLRPDGSFTVRMALPDRRQVIPVIASSPDGVEQRTIILAVERNTKVLEPGCPRSWRVIGRNLAQRSSPLTAIPPFSRIPVWNTDFTRLRSLGAGCRACEWPPLPLDACTVESQTRVVRISILFSATGRIGRTRSRSA